jgi:hypothetical protein
MSAMQIIIDRLKASPTVTASVPAGSILPVKAPQGLAPPYLLVNLIGEPDRNLLGGAGRYYQSRVSITVIALTGTSAINIGTAVKLALDSVVKASSGSFRDIDIYTEGTDYTDTNDDQSVARRIIDFYVDWRTA